MNSAQRPVKPRPFTGAHLKQWRYQNNVSQSELARALGVNVQTVSNWERDLYTMPPYMQLTLEGLANRLRLGEAPEEIGEPA